MALRTYLIASLIVLRTTQHTVLFVMGFRLQKLRIPSARADCCRIQLLIATGTHLLPAEGHEGGGDNQMEIMH